MISLRVLVFVMLSVSGTYAGFFEDFFSAFRQPAPTFVRPKVGYKINELDIKTNIKNRYASTAIKVVLENPASYNQDITYDVFIPTKAFISSLVVESNGTNYTAKIISMNNSKSSKKQKLNENTNKFAFNQNGNKFSITTEIPADKSITMYISYEELLKRTNGLYENVVNLYPSQFVKKLKSMIIIEEFKDIISINVPPFHQLNSTKDSNDRVNIIQMNPQTAFILFQPSVKEQEDISESLNTFGSIAIQLVIRYDVTRNNDGDVLSGANGHFIEFFAPDQKHDVKQHVVLVVDVSESMSNQMNLVKSTIKSLVRTLSDRYMINLISFNDLTTIWNFDALLESIVFPLKVNPGITDFSQLSTPPAYKKTAYMDTITNIVDAFNANGPSNAFSALKSAVHIIQSYKNKSGDNISEPLITFLSDGNLSMGKLNGSKLISDFVTLNNMKIKLTTVGFGPNADNRFLEDLAAENSGSAYEIRSMEDIPNVARDIFTYSLSNIKFDFPQNMTELTNSNFPAMHQGSEIVVAGKSEIAEGDATITATSVNGTVTFTPKVWRLNDSFERPWAYLSIWDCLRKGTKDCLENVAIPLALKYSFVIPTIGMALITPEGSSIIESEYIVEKSKPMNNLINNTAAAPKAVNPILPQSAPTRGLGPIVQNIIKDVTRSVGEIFGTILEPLQQITAIRDLPSKISPVKSTIDLPYILPDLIKSALPWLEEYLYNDGKAIFFRGPYTFGFKENSSFIGLECTTPTSQLGSCQLLIDSSRIFDKLLSPLDLQDRACEISEKYIGVCVPK